MSKITDTSAATKTYPTGWSETILICKKCSKKLSGGFGDGGYDPLRKALREALKAAGRRGQVGLIEVPWHLAARRGNCLWCRWDLMRGRSLTGP
jgi:hypothetical protein